jgi:hypothetical protein
VNQDRADVTVVRATTTPLAVDRAQCDAIDGLTVDCTAALSASTTLPAFHQLVLTASGDVSACRLLRVTTASKSTGLANASGIGFWSAQAAAGNMANHNAGTFVVKSQLKPAGTATLADGSAATLHEFIGVANCGAADGVVFERLFKPYMQFEGAADGKIYRNWDLAENYRISPTITQFDRSKDVLRP